MPRAKRILFPGAYYHVYNRGVNKLPIVFDNRDRQTFLFILAKCIPEFQTHLFAYCLMDNHFHFYLQTFEANLDKMMHSFSRQFSLFINQRYDRIGPLCQGRYQARLDLPQNSGRFVKKK